MQSASDETSDNAAHESETDKIALVVDDMFFAAKIRGAADAAGRTVQRITALEQFGSELMPNPPSLVLVDLHAERIDPIQAIEHVKSQPRFDGVPIVGFFSHVQTDLKQRAEQAGCDHAIPRSLFSRIVGELVRGDLSSLPASSPAAHGG